MASIRMTIPIARPAPEVWDAVADTGAVHERLARGFVVDTCLDGDSRIVTFENGLVARELLVDLDPSARRIAYAVLDSPLGMRHHHASMEVVANGHDASRLLWVADVAPDDAGPSVGELMRLGAVAMQRTLEQVDGTSSGSRPRSSGTG